MHTSFNYDICKIENAEAKKAAHDAAPRVDVKPGDHVFHKKFGEGTVGQVDGDKATIEFHDGAVKKFNTIALAKLGCLTVYK